MYQLFHPCDQNTWQEQLRGGKVSFYSKFHRGSLWLAKSISQGPTRGRTTWLKGVVKEHWFTGRLQIAQSNISLVNILALIQELQGDRSYPNHNKMTIRMKPQRPYYCLIKKVQGSFAHVEQYLPLINIYSLLKYVSGKVN